MRDYYQPSSNIDLSETSLLNHQHAWIQIVWRWELEMRLRQRERNSWAQRWWLVLFRGGYLWSHRPACLPPSHQTTETLPVELSHRGLGHPVILFYSCLSSLCFFPTSFKKSDSLYFLSLPHMFPSLHLFSCFLSIDAHNARHCFSLLFCFQMFSLVLSQLW